LTELPNFWLLLLLFDLGPTNVCTEIVFQLYETEGFTPIYNCHVVRNNEIVGTTDKDGLIKLNIEQGDTLLFSCVGYDKHKIVISKGDISLKKMTVFLDVSTTILPEIMVNEMPTEYELKQKILNTQPDINDEAVVAEYNLSNAWRAGIYSQSPEMDAFDNYENYLKGPQPVVIWSSSGNKGLLKSIMQINKSKRIPTFRPSYLNRDQSEFDLWKHTISPDSLKNPSMDVNADEK